ncbi:hypothetical protein KK062_00085 [Fulvivirgaceae bacterium PWU5]|uniref:Uncharacterized protein n=1 Tax=Dawidia cretensis TaxID=2782350 RepID=A0AAP2DVT3_9BACT|nr:hypothetical protein [Dawidia cretensis]MBT1706594.1 hypothetical protein [Dawidia cretensis]
MHKHPTTTAPANVEILLAIQYRRVLSFHYEGFHRLVEPYCYGLSPTGTQVLWCFQHGGGNATRTFDWLLVDLSHVRNIAIVDKHFSRLRDGYDRANIGIDRVFSQI